MTIFNYGGRIGMSSLIFFVKELCRIYLKYASRIINYINASTLTAEQKSTVLAWLAAAQASCIILEELQYTYEA